MHKEHEIFGDSSEKGDAGAHLRTAERIPLLAKCVFWLFCIVVIAVPRILDLNCSVAKIARIA